MYIRHNNKHAYQTCFIILSQDLVFKTLASHHYRYIIALNMTSFILFFIIATPFVALILLMLADLAGILDFNSNRLFLASSLFVKTLILPIVIFIGPPLLIWSIFKYFTVKNDNGMKIKSRNSIFYITLIFFIVIIFYMFINLTAETYAHVPPGPLPTIP